jgi:hypothetical protein
MQSGSTVEVDTAAAAIEAKARNAQRAKKYRDKRRKELADQVTVLGGVSKDGTTHTHTHTHTTTTIYNVHGNLIGNSTGQGGATISAPVTTGSV